MGRRGGNGFGRREWGSEAREEGRVMEKARGGEKRRERGEGREERKDGGKMEGKR